MDSCDVKLSYRVIAVCAAHGDQFSPQSSGLLTQWSEQFAQVLLARHKSSDSPSQCQQQQQQEESRLLPAYSQRLSNLTKLSEERVAAHMQPSLQPTGLQPTGLQPTGLQPTGLQRQYSNDMRPTGWHGVDGNPGAPPNQSGLSVVATVWGMTPGSQVPPVQQAPNFMENVNPYQRGVSSRTHMVANGYPQHQQQPPLYRQKSLTAAPGPGMSAPLYRPQYKAGNPDYQPPPGALSAAAMVAAAATATATATATASMMVQGPPHQQYHPASVQSHHPNQMVPQYVSYNSQQNMKMTSPPVGQVMIDRDLASQSSGGPIQNRPSMYRRPSPYGNPQQAMMQKRVGYDPTVSSVATPASMVQYGPINPQHQQTYQPNMSAQDSLAYMSGDQGPHSANFPHMMQNSRAPPPYSGIPNYAPVQGIRRTSAAPHPHGPYQNGYMQPSAVGSGIPDVKPVLPVHLVEELKFTFPVRNGSVLQPFRLEHGLTVTHHPFYLKESYFHMLMERPGLELQLKCFYHNDPEENANWPASVSVTVNNQPFPIERNGSHKPIYFKNVCVPNKNVITISVGQCCCSHMFSLQIVHRPTVRSILQALLTKNVLPEEKCIAKIKRNFSNNNGSGINADTDGVEQTSVKISLKCPITFRRIMMPARGIECCHIQCFDLEPYLRLNTARGLWRCPICNKNAPLEGIEIDQYMRGILEHLSKNDVDEINIDASATWKPNLPTVSVKEEIGKADACSISNYSWMKVYSPSSTNLPSVAAYDNGNLHNPTSPYPTPPNSHNSQGSTSINHFNGGVYDIGFNSPPDFNGPMSNRSDTSENEKRMAGLQRQQSGISSPQGASVSGNSSTGLYNRPASNTPLTNIQQANNSVASGGPPSNAPPSHGGPPSNAPPSHGGPPSNAPASNQSASANNCTELSADFNDLVQGNSADNSLESLDDQDLLAYLGPQANADSSNNENSQNNENANSYDDILAFLSET